MLPRVFKTSKVKGEMGSLFHQHAPARSNEVISVRNKDKSVSNTREWLWMEYSEGERKREGVKMRRKNRREDETGETKGGDKTRGKEEERGEERKTVLTDRRGGREGERRR